MKFWSRKSFLALCSLVLLVAGGLFCHAYWKKIEQKKEDWIALARDFQHCDLTIALWRMGKPDLYKNNIGLWLERAESNSQLQTLLTFGYRDGTIKDLDDVWMDPNIPHSLSFKKTTINSINLRSQCDSRIAEGKFQTGLNLAYYYLYVGHPKAADHLNNLGQRGVIDAYVLLGHAYRRGLLSSVKDEKLAFAFYLKAAHKGSIKGMLNAAELLRSVDFDKSKQYVLAAANEGSLEAAYMLQNMSGDYRASAPGKFPSNNDLKILYFWNLVFASLSAADSKEGISDSVEKSGQSPFILESDRGFEYDNVPHMAWGGNFTASAIEAKVVEHYDENTTKKNQDRLEAALDSDTRIQVQTHVKQWMAARKDRNKAELKGKSLPNRDHESTPMKSGKDQAKMQI